MKYAIQTINGSQRVVAARDIERYRVKAGEVGGIVSSANSLSQQGDCWVKYNARIDGAARVKDNALVTGNSVVTGLATVTDNAAIYGNSFVANSTSVGDEAVINSGSIIDSALVYGNATVLDATISSNAMVYGTAMVYGGARIGLEADVYQKNHWLHISNLVGNNPGVDPYVTIYNSHDGVVAGINGYAYFDEELVSSLSNKDIDFGLTNDETRLVISALRLVGSWPSA